MHAAVPLLHGLHGLNVVDVTDDSSSSLVMVSDLGLSETVKFLCADSVEVDGVDEGDEEAGERHAHSFVIGHVVSSQSSERWEEGTAAN